MSNRSSSSDRPARRVPPRSRPASHARVSARVCSRGRVASPVPLALAALRALKPIHSGSPIQSGSDRSPAQGWTPWAEPAGQVPHVDDLGRLAGGVRHQDGPVRTGRPTETQRPVAGTVGDVPRAADQSDPGDQARVGTEGVEDVSFTSHLGLPVGLHGLHDLAVEGIQQRPRLVLAPGVVVGVDAGRRDEHEALASAGQRLRRLPDLAGLACHVDDNVPALSGHRVVDAGLVAVRTNKGRTRRRLARDAPGHAGDLMTGGDGRSCQVATEPGGSAEDENLHVRCPSRP